jgi:hypothetical protein
MEGVQEAQVFDSAKRNIGQAFRICILATGTRTGHDA